MTFCTHKYDFYIALIPIIFPILFGFNQMVINHWIAFYLCKHIIVDHSNLKDIGNFYNKHHKMKQCNYSDSILDSYYDSLITNTNTKITNEQKKKILISSNHYLNAIKE